MVQAAPRSLGTCTLHMRVGCCVPNGGWRVQPRLWGGLESDAPMSLLYLQQSGTRALMRHDKKKLKELNIRLSHDISQGKKSQARSVDKEGMRLRCDWYLQRILRDWSCNKGMRPYSGFCVLVRPVDFV